MTFLELQNLIVQTRKARRGISNRIDYWKDEEPETEIPYLKVYQRALRIANKVVDHYISNQFVTYDPDEKVSVIFGDQQPTVTKKQLVRENQRLQEQVAILSNKLDTLRDYFDTAEQFAQENKQLKEQVTLLSTNFENLRENLRHGGRKGYGKDMIAKVKKARDNGETWRSLSKRLGISTATAQKLYKK